MNPYEKDKNIYSTFLDYSTEAMEELLYLKRALPEKLDSPFPANHSDCMRVLDVGCGEGSKSISLYRFLSFQRPVKYFALEPAAPQLEQFQSKLPKAEKNDFQFINQPLEEYDPQTTFDFIYCSHSFYYFEDWLASLRKMLNWLEEEGKLLIVVQRENNLSFQLSELSNEKIHEGNRNEVYCARDVAEFFEKNKIQYELITNGHQINVGAVKDQKSKGIKLLEFFLAENWSDIPPEIQQEVLGKVKRMPNVVKNEVGFFWIDKKANQSFL